MIDVNDIDDLLRASKMSPAAFETSVLETFNEINPLVKDWIEEASEVPP